MKKDAKTMKEVAERCTRYCSCGKDGCGCGSSNATNSTKEGNVTCQTCTHYDQSNVCDIDLYEEIVKKESNDDYTILKDKNDEIVGINIF